MLFYAILSQSQALGVTLDKLKLFDKLKSMTIRQLEESFSSLAKALHAKGHGHKSLHGLLDLALDETADPKVPKLAQWRRKSWPIVRR